MNPHHKQRLTPKLSPSLLLAGALALPLALAGCSQEGPAEQAGEEIDEAMEASEGGQGPAEHAGEALDEGMEKAGEKMEQAGEALGQELERAKEKAGEGLEETGESLQAQ
jgi:hypothetical protein